MKFNINHYVRVKLTDYGKEILKKNDLEFLHKPDEDGFSKWQLWVLMETFGKYTHLGYELPFGANIEILEN